MLSVVNRVVLWDGGLAGIEGLVRQAVAPARLVRWAVVAIAGARLVIEAAVWEPDGEAVSQGPEPPAAGPSGPVAGGARDAGAGEFAAAHSVTAGRFAPARSTAAGDFVVAQILPTGIGLEIGGYAGDGTPATNVLAAAADLVITHPNAVNAAVFNWAAPNIRYVEGALLDLWLGGRIALRPVRANRLGVLVDRAVADAGGFSQVENAVNAFRTVAGGCAEILLSSEPLQLGLAAGPSGATCGSLGNPEMLLAGARTLVRRGAAAVAIVADFSRLPLDTQADAYLAGRGPDPIGGLEAILSHLVAQELLVPCAHAPYLPPSAEPCDPRAAAEELGVSFIACILKGLHQAPIPAPAQPAPSAAPALAPAPAPGDGPDAVVAPQGALGGPGVLAAAARGIPIIAVHNPSVLAVKAADLGIPAIPAASYLEAAGIVLALRAGIHPAAVRREAARLTRFRLT